jgi:hypothetical protein
MAVKIPRRVNIVWDAVENNRLISAAAVVAVATLVSLVFVQVLAILGAAAGTALLMRAANLAKTAGLEDELAATKRELVLARGHVQEADADVRRLQQDAAARMAATSVTLRTPYLPAVEDGQEDR